MELKDFFKLHPRVAIAFSGGVDSTYLLYEATRHAEKVRAYFVKSAFQPRFELEEARKLAKMLGVDLTVIEVDVFESPEVLANSPDRCYLCKKVNFSRILEQAKKDGLDVLLDGTNASDDAADRPGMLAMNELSVLSPLRECDLTKEEIRRRSKEAGLPTWDKPAYACLATRIPTNEIITKEKLQNTEAAEGFLFSLGFTDFRVRLNGTTAKIQVPADQFAKIIEKRKEILQELKKYYTAVTLDLEARHE